MNRLYSLKERWSQLALPTPLRHFLGSLVEAFLVLLITQVPIFFALVLHVLQTEGETLSWATAKSVLEASFTSGDVLGYVAGILGSSTAYAIVKIQTFRHGPVRMLFLILAPIVLILVASPIYFQDATDQIQNPEFARTYVNWLVLASVCLWLYALYQARAFFDAVKHRDQGADKIIHEIGGAE